MNPLYNMLMGNRMNTQNPMNSPANPMQKMAMMMQAMQNPSAFVKQVFPDIPQEIQYDPNRILQYLQQTRHISNDQIQNLINQNPYPGR